MGSRASISKNGPNNTSAGWGEVTDEYAPQGSSTPDTTVAIAAKVEGSSVQDPATNQWTQGPRGEILLKTDNTIIVPGFISQAQSDSEKATAVAAATSPPERVLPSGYSNANVNGKIRITVPGGEWVEYDPTAGTFLVS